jgi:hypothetical protein
MVVVRTVGVLGTLIGLEALFYWGRMTVNLRSNSDGRDAVRRLGILRRCEYVVSGLYVKREGLLGWASNRGSIDLPATLGS